LVNPVIGFGIRNCSLAPRNGRGRRHRRCYWALSRRARLDDRKETTMVERTPESEGAGNVQGLDVYGSDGQKIGKVDQVLSSAESGRRYLLVKAGLLGTEEYYVPESAIEMTGQDRIVLTVTGDEIKGRGWVKPPEGHRHL
jgi:hypothetical protein